MESTSGKSLRAPRPQTAARVLGVCLLLALSVCARAEVCPKVEAAFTIANLATDPFDYAQTDVRVQIRQPDGATNSWPAFFDGGTTWRVRHTPSRSGLHEVAGVTLNICASGSAALDADLSRAAIGGPTRAVMAGRHDLAPMQHPGSSLRFLWQSRGVRGTLARFKRRIETARAG